MSSLRFYCWLVYLSSIGSITGCQASNSLEAAISSPKVTPIENISTQTEQSTLIYIRGKVSNRAPFLTDGTYQLTDPTGQIWIRTSEPLPKVGETILVQGKVQAESLSLAGKEEEQSYIIEIKKLQQKEQDEPDSQPHK